LLYLKEPRMSSIVTVDLFYDVRTGATTFKETTTAKPEAISEIIEAFLMGEVGAGVDNSPANEREVYSIRLDLDLDGDVFHVTSDCGNLGLRDGILMSVLRDLV
jgi:hypothetical protein